MPIFTAASEMIQAALELIEVQDPAETMDAGQASTGLRALNLLLDEWSVDRGKVYIRTEDTFTLVVGIGSYAIGTGQTWNTVLPVKIEQAYLVDTGLTPYINKPLRVNMTQAEYNSRPIDTIQSIPSAIYFQGGTDPGTVYFDYLPGSAYDFHMFSHKPFTKLTDVNTALVMPDGYEAAAVPALAIRLCPIYGKQPSQVLIALATKTENALDAKNLEPPPTWQDRSQPKTMSWSRS
jgi:hypothetical protein